MGRSGNSGLKKDINVLLLKLSYLAVFFILKVLFFTVNERNITSPNDVISFLDELIPFNRFFIIPYVYWYLFLAIGFIFFALMDYKKYFKMLAGIFVGESAAIVVYFFYPTTTPRPLITGTDIFSDIIRHIYAYDAHMNCLPSMHMFQTLIIALFFLKYSKKIGMQLFVWISAVSIIASTFYVKQHAVVDLFVSLILTYAVYYFITSDKIFKNDKVKRLLNIIIPEKVRYDFGYYSSRGKLE